MLNEVCGPTVSPFKVWEASEISSLVPSDLVGFVGEPSRIQVEIRGCACFMLFSKLFDIETNNGLKSVIHFRYIL